jgi:hypothetical protein
MDGLEAFLWGMLAAFAFIGVLVALAAKLEDWVDRWRRGGRP